MSMTTILCAFFGRWPSWHTFVRSETYRYCVFCVLPLAKLAMLMNMAEYGFSFRHKLSLAICIICKYTTMFQRSSFTRLIHYVFPPTLFRIEYVSSIWHPIYRYIYQPKSFKSLVSHLPFSKAPNSTEAARRYRRLVQPSASADSTASHKDVRKGNLSEIQVPLLEDVVAYVVYPLLEGGEGYGMILSCRCEVSEFRKILSYIQFTPI